VSKSTALNDTASFFTVIYCITIKMAFVDEEKAGAAYVEYSSRSREQPEAKMNASTYIKTRISTLKPTLTLPENPIKLLGLLSRKDWLFFSVNQQITL